MKNDKPPPEDFAAVMAGVRRQAPSRRHPPHRAPLSPRPRQLEADEKAVLDELLAYDPDDGVIDTGDQLEYRAAGLQDGAFRRLRRGTYRVEASLDLHGMTANIAKHAVAAFLADAKDRDLRCVHIIHGKGLRSPGAGPVLKHRLDGWLRRRKDVLAFASARPRDGGLGAVYVLLRAPA